MTRGFHKVVLRGRDRPSPGMVRLTFALPPLGGLATTGIPDEYLRLFYPDPATGQVVLPRMDANGGWIWPEAPAKARFVTLTVRRFDPAAGEMEIDVLARDAGPASRWAQTAEPGAAVFVTAPVGRFARPEGARWQLLAADAAGLPAVARILQETPRTVASHLILEVAGPGQAPPLPRHPLAQVHWVHGGNGRGPSRLAELVCATPLPPGSGYVWAAAEQKAVRAIRRHLRGALGLSPDRYALVAYWIAKAERWRAGWDALDPAIRARMDAAWASGRDPADIHDEVDATLEVCGL